MDRARDRRRDSGALPRNMGPGSTTATSAVQSTWRGLTEAHVSSSLPRHSDTARAHARSGDPGGTDGAQRERPPACTGDGDADHPRDRSPDCSPRRRREPSQGWPGRMVARRDHRGRADPDACHREDVAPSNAESWGHPPRECAVHRDGERPRFQALELLDAVAVTDRRSSRPTPVARIRSRASASALRR